MKLSLFLPLMAACFLAACSTDGYQPYLSRGLDDGAGEKHDLFTLQRTPCYGFCPAYKVTVDDRDIITFEGERFVIEDEGAVGSHLPDGSFKKLLAIAKAYDFTSFDAAYPNEGESNCPRMATDMPSVILGYDAGKLKHKVSFYEGCMGFEGRERLEAMVAEIDAVLAVDKWIGPREQFYGRKE